MAENLTAESFAEYGIGMAFLLVRLYARLSLGGIRGLRLDDAFAVAAMVFWTMMTTIIYFLGSYGTNIGLTEQSAMLVPDSKVPDMILGSKLAFSNWIWYMTYIWCQKGVLLCLFWKLTQGTWHTHLVAGTAVLCVVTWLACILTHVCLCTPLYHNWQIKPYPGDHCTLRQPLYVVIAVLNVITDICIMLIPIPILTKLQVPLQRKLILAVMFSSGFFIMICTVLRCYYSLGDITNLPIALGWADRECFVAAIVVSLPGIKPLFRNTRWLGSTNRKDSKVPYHNGDGYNHFGSKTSGKTKTFISSRRSMSHGRHYEMDSVLRTEKGSRLSSGDSEEYILESATSPAPRENGQAPESLAIHVTTEYRLESERGGAGRSVKSPMV
ncbi:uncharacterized protein N7482_002417 [Penicillium canariense]|uniref:Rhodopsin domain-containing protein n=1 Tax=Penicillium canariense TaxID=189055 RepID=A0A9W9LUG1_9EURO|nr:uncharacterized protein N7482_002417 [Penicillium canariense]KAJ5176540.1 hypothetical protein N7482_002417 [Penicillium canariense]